MSDHPKLEYFYFDSCPFCMMVSMHIKKLGVKVDYKNIHEDESNLKRLVGDTGRRTVPCLYIDNVPMFESRDIMKWLSENESKLEKLP